MRPTMSRGSPNAALLRAGWVGDTTALLLQVTIDNSPGWRYSSSEDVARRRRSTKEAEMHLGTIEKSGVVK
jgi:hypothetical protein